jgi:TolA-binding protein
MPRARWAEDELLQYHRMLHNVFRLELDVPPPTLKAANNVPEANKLYRQAMAYKDKGWGTDYIDNQRRAEILFQKLLTEYPQSDKISNTAFQLGDLYESKAFKQPERAAAYYERCFEWNPKTHHDARIRAARLYERQLNNRDKAVKIYKEITTHETDEGHIEEARRRLQELSNRR